MERSITHRLATRALVLALGASTLAVAAIASARHQDLIEYPVLAGRQGQAQGHGQVALPETTACLESALAAGRNSNAFSGFSVAVLLDGRVVYRKGFGTVSPASTQPVLPSTRFRFASLAKSMTATAVLSLAEDRELRLHAPVKNLLPGFELVGDPGWSDTLTAHLLISHQGGIADTVTLFGPVDDGALAAAFYDPAFLQTIPLLVAPGTFYNYSNPNFALAGLLAETAAGKPYRQVMRERVFKPLGMKRTTFLASDVLQDNDFAYGVLGATIWAPEDYENTILRPAGFGWTSLDDLAKWASFILDGDRNVLSPRMWRTLQSPHVNTHEFLDYVSYGYGLIVQNAATLLDRNGQPNFYAGLKVIVHDGVLSGYQSFMLFLPEQRFGYVSLINADASNPLGDPTIACFRSAAKETIATRLPAPSPFPDLDIQRERFADYVGTYNDRLGFGSAIVTLTPAGDLNVQFPALDSIGFRYNPVLQPTSRNNFAWNTQAGSLPLTGFRGGDSAIEHLRLRVTVLTRTAGGQAALAAAPAIDLKTVEQAIRAAAQENNPLLQLRP